MRALWVLGVAMAASAATAPKEPTFYKDVLPVLQKNCQSCHRSGEAAPMAFTSYKDTRPWAKAIKQAVVSKTMPPWFADPAHGKWANDRTMSIADSEVLSRWADTGAREGRKEDAPAPVEWIQGWGIGKPDLVVSMPNQYEVPASGTIDYQYVILPTGLTEDRWVSMAEARPGNRQLVHHIIAFVREPGSKWLAGEPVGVPMVPKKSDRDRSGEFLVGFAPGSPPEVLKPGRAKLLKAGSDLVLQMHYTANGKSGVDQSSIGIIFAKEAPKQRVMTAAVSTNKFAIPPGADNYPVTASMTLQEDSEFLSLLPHMHLRGKAFEYRAVYPTGETEVLLRVPKYRFDWQLWYEFATPKAMPKGTRIEVTGYFDNSANNRFNPDPTKEVKWGEQSWEEMMMGFFDVAIDVKMDPMDLFRSKKKPAGSDD